MQKQSELNISTPIESVDSYEFEPIQGYPRLNWKGKRPFQSTQYFPSQLKETYGQEIEGWRNKIYWGDNLQVMSHLLKNYRGKINLIYLDPPFDSKADYKKQIELKGKTVENDRTAFEEKQYTDIWTNDEYLQFMYERLILMRELLSDRGSIYLHCDPTMSHYLKLVMDEVFTIGRFQNEIVWAYRTGGVGKTAWPRKHDILLFYSKASQYTHKALQERIYYEKPFFNVQVDDEGRYYADVYIRDTWDDIKPVINVSKERLDYPTQKPEALIERIINASSNPGDIVFDCFMGSGTTQAVAMKLGRRFIGADINLGAIEITTQRLTTLATDIEQNRNQVRFDVQNDGAEVHQHFYTGFDVYNVNHYDVFRNPVEAKDLLMEALEIHSLQTNSIFDGEKDGRVVKIMPINRIATRADLNELIAGFDYQAFEKRQQEHPASPVEYVLLVCMGHEPDLAAALQHEVPHKLDIVVMDVLRDKSNLEFKRASEAKIVRRHRHLIINQFYPMNLLQKLSLVRENVEDWRELVESVKIDFNYDGAVMNPLVVDLPEVNELVEGTYEIPEGAGTIRVKITDLLSESLEMTVE